MLTTVVAGEEIQPVWCYTHPQHTIGDISISGDGSFIVGELYYKGVILLNKNGEVVWEKELGGRIEGVAISDDGEIIAAISVPETNKFVIYLLSKDGSIFRKIEHKIDVSRYPKEVVRKVSESGTTIIKSSIKIDEWDLAKDILQVNNKYVLVNIWNTGSPSLFWVFSVEDGSLVEDGTGFPWDVFLMWEWNERYRKAPLCDSSTVKIYKKYGFTKKSFCPGSYFNVSGGVGALSIADNRAVVGDWAGYVYVFNNETGELLYKYEIGNVVPRWTFHPMGNISWHQLLVSQEFPLKFASLISGTPIRNLQL